MKWDRKDCMEYFSKVNLPDSFDRAVHCFNAQREECRRLGYWQKMALKIATICIEEAELCQITRPGFMPKESLEIIVKRLHILTNPWYLDHMTDEDPDYLEDDELKKHLLKLIKKTKGESLAADFEEDDGNDLPY